MLFQIRCNNAMQESERSKRRDIIHDSFSKQAFKRNRNNDVHERIFMRLLLNCELKDHGIAKQFIAYMVQYHKEYKFLYTNYYNFHNMALLEVARHEFILWQQANGLEVSRDSAIEAKNFGEYATEFCIRVLGYNLIGISGCKSIITASDNANTDFDEYLKNGYTVFKMRKIKYIDSAVDLFGHFQEFAALPMKDNFFNNAEYIEDCDHKFQKVLKR